MQYYFNMQQTLILLYALTHILPSVTTSFLFQWQTKNVESES